MQVSWTQNAVTAFTQATFDGLEREAAPLALHEHRGKSLGEDRHVPKVCRRRRTSKSREGLDSSAPNSPFLDGGARVVAAPLHLQLSMVSMDSARGTGDGSRSRRGNKAPYFLKPEREGMVSVYRRPAGNRIDPKLCGTMPSRAMAAALVGQLMRAESVVKDLFLEATDDGIEALEAVLLACRTSVMERGARSGAAPQRSGARPSGGRRRGRRRGGRRDLPMGESESFPAPEIDPEA